MKERTWSQILDAFEENEIEREVFGCCVWAYEEERDGEGAHFGRRRGTLNVAGVERA